MRVDPIIDDKFLTLQSLLSYGAEKIFYYRHTAWKEAKVVLDVGCGNGYYTHLLAKDNPDKRFVGLEINEAIARIAQQKSDGVSNLAVHTGSFWNLPEDFSFDFLLLRHAARYFLDMPPFWEWIGHHAAPQAGILVIDTAGEHFYIEPQLPVFLAEMSKRYDYVDEEQNQRLRSIVEGEIAKIGFRHVGTHPIILNSEPPVTKEKVYKYMYLAMKLAIGSPVPPLISQELYGWMLNPQAYAQWGIFGASFDRGYERHTLSNFG